MRPTATPAEKAMLMDGFGDAFLLAAGFALVALLSGALSRFTSTS